MLDKFFKNRIKFYSFLLSLAVADINVAFINILPQILWRKSVLFNIGNTECKIVAFSQVI